MRAWLKLSLFSALLITLAVAAISMILWQPLHALKQQQTLLQSRQLWDETARQVRRAHPSFSSRLAVQKQTRDALAQIKQALHRDVALYKAPATLLSSLLPPQETALLEKLQITKKRRFILALANRPGFFVFQPLYPKQNVWLGVWVESQKDRLDGLLFNILLITAVLIVIAFAGTGYYMRKLLEPLQQVRSDLALDSIAKPKSGQDEFSRIAEEFTALAGNLQAQLEAGKQREAGLRQDLKETQNKMVRITDNLERAVARRASEVREKDAQLLQSGKLAGLGQLSTGIAHEINQPLNVIKLTVTGLLRQYSLQRNLEIEEVVEELRKINQQTVRVQKIIEHMKAFARKRGKQEYDEIDMNTPVRESLLLVGQQLKAHQIELNLQLDEQLPKIKANPYQVEQILINLINNARDALDEKGQMLSESAAASFQKRIDIRTFSAEGKVHLWIRDNGKGMSDEVRQQLFEPFFSTKTEKKGTGLGMSITYNLIKSMNGDILVRSEKGKGTEFTVSIPVAESSAAVS